VHEQEEEEANSNKPAFVLDTWAVAAASRLGSAMLPPAPITPTKQQLKLREQTPGSNYGPKTVAE